MARTPEPRSTKRKAAGRGSPGLEPPALAAAIVRALLPLNVLELLAREPRHGMGLAEQISRASGGTWSPGPSTVYPLLARLEAQGLVTSRTEKSTGAPRKVLRLTAKGKRARLRLRAAMVEELESAKFLVDRHLEVFRSDEPPEPHSAEEMAAALRGQRPRD